MLYLVNINLNQNEVQNVRIHNLATAPSSPVAGQIYYNTASNNMFMWDGTVWQPWKDAGVTSVTATTNGLSATPTSGAVVVSLALANGTSPGAMTATHYNNLSNATSALVGGEIVKRDNNGNVYIANPVAGGHAATKDYVDNIAKGLNIKAAVTAATTTNITLSGTQTIDGVALSVGDRVLVKNQTALQFNGVYIVAAGAWTRALDYAAGTTADSTFMFVQKGTTLADTGWVCTDNKDQAVVGSWSLNYTQFTGAGAGASAGLGISVVGNVVSINTALVVRKFVATGITIGSGTSVTVTHNLNTQTLIVKIIESSTNIELEADIVMNGLNTCVITAIGANRTVNVIVVG